MDNSVLLDGSDHHARQALAQHITRAPLSLQKLTYHQPDGKVLYHTTYNPYFSVEQEFGVLGARGKRVIRSTNVKIRAKRAGSEPRRRPNR